MIKTIFVLLVILASFASHSVRAKDYHVEALIFSNSEPQTAYESTHYVPIAEVRSDAPTWPLERSMLNDEAAAITRSPSYQLIAHYSWGQEALPTSESAIYPVAAAEVQGWLKIYASHLLFANLDLDFNGYRMTEKRRLKLNEKHFFDHPKFGVLLRVSRLEPPQEDANDDKIVEKLSSSK